jgi:hypothetical protein
MAPGQNEIASTIHRSALSLNTGGISPAQRGIALSFATRDDPDRVVARRPLKPQRLGRLGRIGVERAQGVCDNAWSSFRAMPKPPSL